MQGWEVIVLLGVAAAVQGFLGFGFGLIAMGGLSLLFGPHHAAGVVNLTGLLLTVSMAIMLRHRIDWGSVRRIMPASVVGIGIGLLTLDRLPGPVLLVLLGVTIAAMALWNLSPWAPQTSPSRRWDAPVGLASGLLTGLFNTGGPPLVAHFYRRPDPPEVLIGSVQALFVLNALVRLPGAYAMGMLTPEVWRHAGLAAAFVVLGAWVGRSLGSRMSPMRFRRASWATLAILGVWIAFSA